MTDHDPVHFMAAMAGDTREASRMHGLLQRWYRLPKARRSAAEQEFWSTLTDHSFELDGSTIVLRSFGTGPTVLLVHGEGGHGGQFAALASTLKLQGYRALLVDINGPDEERVRQISVRQIAGILNAVARREGPLHGMVVHSMGNVWTWYAIVTGLHVERLVAMSGILNLDWVFGQFQILNGLNDTELADFKQALATLEGSDLLALHDPLVAMTRVLRPRHGLIIHAAEDEVLPAQLGRSYTRAWPEAHFLEVEGCTHGTILNAPRALNVITDFLSSTLYV